MEVTHLSFIIWFIYVFILVEIITIHVIYTEYLDDKVLKKENSFLKMHLFVMT